MSKAARNWQAGAIRILLHSVRAMSAEKEGAAAAPAGSACPARGGETAVAREALGRFADFSLKEEDLVAKGKHVLVSYAMKPKAGCDYRATAARFAAKTSEGVNVNEGTPDAFGKSVDALVYYIDPKSEDMKTAHPNTLFDRNIIDQANKGTSEVLKEMRECIKDVKAELQAFKDAIGPDLTTKVDELRVVVLKGAKHVERQHRRLKRRVEAIEERLDGTEEQEEEEEDLDAVEEVEVPEDELVIEQQHAWERALAGMRRERALGIGGHC